MRPIHYAQCWEDTQPLLRALEVGPGDDVLSIASGGDNSFALLLGDPRSLAAVDRDPPQIFLVELKLKAIERLGYEEFVGFIGARASHERMRLYGLLRPYLRQETRQYWDRQARAIRDGIIHCGKFERYFKIFRRLVLPLIHSRPVVRRLLVSSSLDEQKMFFDRVWNNARWQALFRVFFGRFLLGHLGRDPSFFRYVTTKNVAEELLDRTTYGLTEIPVSENFYLEYILMGKYSRLNVAPPYLQEANFEVIKQRLPRLRIVRSDLKTYLASLSQGAFSKFYVSDIFEYMGGDEVESTLAEITRVSRQAARLAFWSLFIPRPVPPPLRSRLRPRIPESAASLNGARTFFYGGFSLWEISGNQVELET
jgi:S-adenosylmethionine-diacylglycerol 3-amino-3-carboxypropyl transferase